MSTIDFKLLFETAPGLNLLLLPDDNFTVLAVSDAYLRATQTTRETIQHKPLLQALPESLKTLNPAGIHTLVKALTSLVSTPYSDIQTPPEDSVFQIASEEDNGEKRWWRLIESPVFDRTSQLQYILLKIEDASDTLRVQNALRDSVAESEHQRRLYEGILTNTPDLAYVFDLNYRFIYANEGLLKLWGRTWEEAMGKTCLELGYEPWHAAMHEREIDQVAATKQPVRGEVPFEGPLGKCIYDYIFVPVLDEDGEVEAIAGTTRDITEHKRTEQALRIHSDQFESLLNAAPFGIFMVNSEWKLREINPVAQPVFAGIQDGAIGHDFREVIHVIWEKSFAEEVLQLFQHTLDTGEPYIAPERPNFRADLNVTQYYEWRIARITLPDGLHGVVCYFRDISPQVEARLAIAESEERFRNLADNISQFAWMTDENGWRTWCNRRWLDYTGTTTAEMQGWGWKKMHHPDHVDRVVEKLNHCFATGEPWEDIFQLRGADGQYRWFLSRANPIRDADGNILRWFGTNTDITQQLETEQALREREESLAALNQELAMARDNAIAANAAKGAFLANMSHELRTPLNAIIGYAELLRDEVASGSADSEAIEEDLDRVRSSGRHLLNLIDEILDLSKIEAGRMKLENEPVDVSRLISEAIGTVKPQLAARGNRLEHQSCSDGVCIQGDFLRIKQVLLNLLSNAVKFTENGVVRIECRVIENGDNDAGPTPREEPDTTDPARPHPTAWVQILVSDTGIGIPPEQMPFLFENFRQLDTSYTRRHSGTGLGLAISKRLVEIMEGHITVTSTPGHGSTFTITLPSHTNHLI